jgi:hypothetical protein
MALVMATRYKAFGSCGGEINVPVDMEYRDIWFSCGWKYLRFTLAGKVPQDWLWRWEMVPGIGKYFKISWCNL